MQGMTSRYSYRDFSEVPDHLIDLVKSVLETSTFTVEELNEILNNIHNDDTDTIWPFQDSGIDHFI